MPEVYAVNYAQPDEWANVEGSNLIGVRVDEALTPEKFSLRFATGPCITPASPPEITVIPKQAAKCRKYEEASQLTHLTHLYYIHREQGEGEINAPHTTDYEVINNK